MKNNKKIKPQVEAPKVEAPKVEAPKVENAEVISAEESAKIFEKTLNANQYGQGLDPNRRVDLLTSLTKVFHDDPEAAKRYNMTPEAVEGINQCTAIGLVTALAQEVALGENPFSRTMRPAVLEKISTAAKLIGVTINMKALPAPDEKGNVTITDKDIKVPTEVKKQLKEEKKTLENTPEMDINKINSEDELRTVLVYLLSQRKDYIVNIQKAISIYSAFLEKQEKDSTKGMTRIQLLNKLIKLVGKAPIVVTGIGNFLYSATAATKSPVSAFCHLRNTVTDRKTGKCDMENEFIADIVRELILWAIDLKVDETKKGIESIKENIKVLSKDKKKNEKAIEEQNKRIEVLKKNIEHHNSVAKFVIEPSIEPIETLLEKKGQKDIGACKMYKSLLDSLYFGLDLTKYTTSSVNQNMIKQAGVITNLFRDSLAKIIGYTQGDIPELQEIEETEESKEDSKETPKEESKETPVEETEKN